MSTVSVRYIVNDVDEAIAFYWPAPSMRYARAGFASVTTS
jgi:hypothetical protein